MSWFFAASGMPLSSSSTSSPCSAMLTGTTVRPMSSERMFRAMKYEGFSTKPRPRTSRDWRSPDAFHWWPQSSGWARPCWHCHRISGSGTGRAPGGNALCQPLVRTGTWPRWQPRRAGCDWPRWTGRAASRGGLARASDLRAVLDLGGEQRALFWFGLTQQRLPMVSSLHAHGCHLCRNGDSAGVHHLIWVTAWLGHLSYFRY